MKVRGEVFSGVLRGMPLIEKYYSRLVGLINFSPYKGTVNIKLERSIDIRPFSTKVIDQVLQDGRKKTDAYLAPVRIRKISIVYKIMDVRDKEEEIISKLEKMKNNAHEKLSVETSPHIDEPSKFQCWAIQFKGGIYDNGTIELISKEILREKFNLEDGDTIEIEFIGGEKKKTRFEMPIIIKTAKNKTKNAGSRSSRMINI